MNVGTNVRIHPESEHYGTYYANPSDLVGRITSINDFDPYDGYPIIVEWPNDTENAYNYQDLIDVDLEVEEALLGEEEDDDTSRVL